MEPSEVSSSQRRREREKRKRYRARVTYRLDYWVVEGHDKYGCTGSGTLKSGAEVEVKSVRDRKVYFWARVRLGSKRPKRRLCASWQPERLEPVPAIEVLAAAFGGS
jgi:hypothetical protein